MKIYQMLCEYAADNNVVPGKSEGEPTEKGLNLDGDAMVQFVANHPR